MKTKEAIKYLQTLDSESDIIMATWDKDAFPDLADEDWSYAVDRVDDRMDWAQTHADIERTIEYVLDMNSFRED